MRLAACGQAAGAAAVLGAPPPAAAAYAPPPGGPDSAFSIPVHGVPAPLKKPCYRL